MRSNFVRTSIIALAIAAPLGLALADGKQALKKHPNLFAAQKLALQAYDKLEAAQKANEYDLGGHAQKAKELLKQANDEIKLAAEKAEDNKAK